MRKFIFPYRTGSQSVRALANAMEARVIRRENSRFRGSEDKLVINWGASSMDENIKNEIEKAQVLNHPDAVAIASNKKDFFEKVSEEVNIPPFTTSFEEADSWINKGDIVIVREILTGNSGRGICVFEDVQDWSNYNHERAKLYVKYIPKRQEYRVHVVGDKVIETQRKAKRHDVPADHVNWRVRNHDNGFIFAKNEDHQPPNCVLEESIKAVKLCGLHFGAVDVVYNEYRDKAFVLEVNTAPGLEGSTVDAYAGSINDLKELIAGIPRRVPAEAVFFDEAAALPEMHEENF